MKFISRLSQDAGAVFDYYQSDEAAPIHPYSHFFSPHTHWNAASSREAKTERFEQSKLFEPTSAYQGQSLHKQVRNMQALEKP